MTESLLTLRNIARATDERTLVCCKLPRVPVAHSATVIGFQSHEVVFSALLEANINSLPLDWAARFKIPGVNASTFLFKQLSILPPEKYLKSLRPPPRIITYAELIMPRVLELTFVTEEMRPWAEALGYKGPLFPWDDERRHQLRSEIDAIYSCMYGLNRSELEWVLESGQPSMSFSTLRAKELKDFGEYRTKRLVLKAFDQLVEEGAL